MRSTGLAATFLALIAGVPATFGAPAAGDDAAVVATVNGEPLYFEDLERLLGDMHAEVSETSRAAADLDLLVSRVVNDMLIAQEARALGLHEESPIPEQVQARAERIAVEALEREEITARAVASEEELREAFEDRYGTISFRILTAREREEAEGLRQELEAGADIVALAAEKSIDAYAKRGGLVQDLDRIDMPAELAERAFVMEPGQLEGPIMTSLGWSVLRVESSAPADPERFESVRRSLDELVRFRKAEALRSALGGRLREAHPVVVDDETFAAIEAQRLPDGRLVPTQGDPDTPVAHVGTRAITADAFRQALQLRWSGVANEAAAMAAKPIVLERMIREELLLAEALERGYDGTPEAQRMLSAYETKLLVARFLNDVVAASVDVTPEQMREYYESNREAYRRPPRFHLSPITVASEEEAAAVADLLRQGTNLGWLAQRYAMKGIEAPQDEEGWVTPRAGGGPLQAALVDARAGDVLGPFAQGHGFLLARVNTREDRGFFEYDEVSGNVRQALERLEARRAIHEFVQTARSRSEIVVHEDVLDALRISGSPTGASGPHQGNVP